MTIYTARPTKLTLDKVLANFPAGKKPRDIQVEAAKHVIQFFNEGVKYVFLELPVGAGKSYLAMAFAQALGSSYALTLTKQLQDQYVTDFSSIGMEALKGRKSFTCLMGPKGENALDCAEGKLMFENKGPCGDCDQCPYRVAKERTLRAPHIVANYHSYLFNIGRMVGKRRRGQNRNDEVIDETSSMRPLTICDEAHEMESFLLDTVSVNVRLDKLGFVTAPLPNTVADVSPYFDYIEHELLPKLGDYYAKGEKRGTLDPKTKDELSQLQAKLRGVLANKEESWIPEREETSDRSGYKPGSFTLKPLRVSNYGRQLIGLGERVLLMSGTILNPYQMAMSLGINVDEAEFSTFDSPFPKENRPIYAGNLDMSFKGRDESWPIMVKVIEQLLGTHKTDKGILLCTSNQMLDYISQKLPPAMARRILKATGEQRLQKYNEHMNSREPTILGASGFWEGADLKGDASRFQIIPALPRPHWSGQVKARAESDDGWYDWRTYTKTLQGFGRSVRTETDEAVTYVFDKAFRNEFNKPEGSLIPQWVKSSVSLWDIVKKGGG